MLGLQRFNMTIERIERREKLKEQAKKGQISMDEMAAQLVQLENERVALNKQNLDFLEGELRDNFGSELRREEDEEDGEDISSDEEEEEEDMDSDAEDMDFIVASDESEGEEEEEEQVEEEEEEDGEDVDGSAQ